MKKLMVFLSLALVLVLTMVGCGGTKAPAATPAPAAEKQEAAQPAAEPAAKKLMVSFINAADTDVFNTMRKDALKKVVDPNLYEINYYDANNDIGKQLDFMNTSVTQKVDLIILVPVDSTGVIPGIEAANKAGIPVICLGINATGGETVFVGSDHYESGHMQGAYMAKALPKDAKVLYLEGSPGYDHTVLRKSGFLDALKEANRTDVQILASQTAEYDKAKGMALMETWIQAYKGDGFDAVVAANDQMALGAMEALKVANIEGKMIAGIDATADACQAILDGKMVYTLKQDAAGQGAKCLTVMEDLKAGKTLEEKYLVPYTDVDKTNAADILAGK